MATTDIYVPPNCRTLAADTAKQQVRIGLQGFGGTGKNWSTLGSPDKKQVGFPNCIVLNLDRGLGAHQGCEHILEIPFYLESFGGRIPERKDKLTEWLYKEGTKLKPAQTLIVDSLSKLDQLYHAWFKANENAIALGKNGKYNDFAEYQEKNKWFGEIHNIFGSLQCDIILLAHETEKADKPTTIGQPGMYTGKIRPILTGQFGDTIIKEYTDWFRQLCGTKTQEPKEGTLQAFGMTKQEFMVMQESFVGDTIYYWQTKGDDLFNAKASSLINPPTYIPATFSAFTKYRRNK